MKKNDVKNDSRKDNNLMVKIATFIVDKRRAFYLIFALALVLCVISIPKVQVNNDISSYLPEETETRRGLTLMDDEFITYDTEKIMVTTITTETAEKLKDKLEKVDGVKEVEFENDDDHYKDSAALFTVTLSVRDDLDRELEIVDDLKAQLDGYDFYAYSDSIDDSSKQLPHLRHFANTARPPPKRQLPIPLSPTKLNEIPPILFHRCTSLSVL